MVTKWTQWLLKNLSEKNSNLKGVENYILYLGTQLKNNKKNIIFMDCRKNHILKKL